MKDGIPLEETDEEGEQTERIMDSRIENESRSQSRSTSL